MGQLVGVRSASTLFGTGIAFTTTQIKIIEWNPPEVRVAVTGMETMSMKEIVKEITVDIDQLVPLEKDNKDQDSGVETDTLKRLASTTMQRWPSMCFDSAVKDWMRFSIEQLLQNMACSTAVDMEAKVEVTHDPLCTGSCQSRHSTGEIASLPARRCIDVVLGFEPTR